MFSRISINNILSILITFSMVFVLLTSTVVDAAEAPPELGDYVLNNSWGGEANVLNGPVDLAVGHDGRIYVLNQALSRVTIIKPGEEVFNTFGSFGYSQGQLINLTSIAIDEDGYVYVVGSRNVNRFTADGVYSKTWGDFDNASGIAIRDGFVYIVDSFQHCIYKLTLEGDSVLDEPWCGEGSGERQFNQPHDIAVDHAGYIYVADSGNNRIQKLSPTGEFVSEWGSEGSGDGEFQFPLHIGIGNSGNIYVSDWGNYRFQVFSASFDFIEEWELLGDVEPHFLIPRGMDFDAEGNVLVSVSGIGQVQKYSPTHEFITQWGIPPNTPGQFNVPLDISIDNDGNVIVADTHNRRIQKFNPYGVYITEWNIPYEGIDLSYPNSIAIDSHGFIYVLDNSYTKVLKYDSNGNRVEGWALDEDIIVYGDFPTGIAVDNNGFIYITGGYNNLVHKFKADDGTFVMEWGGEGEIDYPVDIAVDETGYVYVIDRNNFLIRKFTSTGTPVTAWGMHGGWEGAFEEPTALAVDGNGYIYVLDSVLRNIQVFSPDGEFISHWNTYLLESEEQLRSPRGIALDAEGKIYITDTFNERIQVLAPALPVEDPESGLIMNGYFDSQGRTSADFTYEVPSEISEFNLRGTSIRTIEGLDYWTYGGGLPIDRTTESFEGAYSLQLGAPVQPVEQGLGTAWASQVFFIPKGSNPELTFSFNVLTNDSIDRADFLVEIQDAVALNNLAIVVRDGFQPGVPGERPIGTQELGWKTVRYDLASFRGKFVRLVFSNRNLVPDSHGIWSFVEQVSVKNTSQQVFLPMIMH